MYFCLSLSVCVSLSLSASLSLSLFVSHTLVQAMFASADLVCKLVLFRAVYTRASLRGVAYLVLSSAFSIGLLCHPLLAFWICQHVCEDPPSARGSTSCFKEREEMQHAMLQGSVPYQRQAQPTLSYYG